MRWGKLTIAFPGYVALVFAWWVVGGSLLVLVPDIVLLVFMVVGVWRRWWWMVWLWPPCFILPLTLLSAIAASSIDIIDFTFLHVHALYFALIPLLLLLHDEGIVVWSPKGLVAMCCSCNFGFYLSWWLLLSPDAISYLAKPSSYTLILTAPLVLGVLLVTKSACLNPNSIATCEKS